MTFLAWVNAVLALIANAGLPTTNATYVQAPCPAYHAASNCWAKQQRTIYLKDEKPMVVAHELGHAVASDYLTPQLKNRYRKLAGYRPGTAWFGKQVGGYSPSETFADAYASCALGRHVGGWIDNKWFLGPHTDLKPVCRLIRSLR